VAYDGRGTLPVLLTCPGERAVFYAEPTTHPSVAIFLEDLESF
jgi:hypothetical protein